MSSTKNLILTPGEIVKELRERKLWTQSILSEISGIAVSNISNIERGKSRLSEDRAIILAESLGVRPEFILFPNGFERPDLKATLEQIRKRKLKIESKLAA